MAFGSYPMGVPVFKFDLWLYIGYRCTQRFQWESEGYQDLTNWSALLQVKETTDSDAVIEASTDDQSIILGPEGWISLNFLVPDFVSSFDGVWDLVLRDPDLNFYPRIIGGRAKVVKPVTQWP